MSCRKQAGSVLVLCIIFMIIMATVCVFSPVADRVVIGLAAIGVSDGVKVASLVRPQVLVLPVTQ